MSSWLRRLPTGTALSIGIALIALVQTVLAALGAPAWLRILFAAVLFLVAVGLELVKLRDKRRETAAAAAEREAATEAERAAWERSVSALVRRWPPRRADEEEPFLLGVQRPVGSECVGQYVRRDIDHAAITKLQDDGVLLVIGEPASGVTRTALHALTQKWPHALLLAPDPDRPDAPRQLLEELSVLSELDCPPTTVVLWLHRIERWLPGGLSAGWLHELRVNARLRVVTTITTAAYRNTEPLYQELFAEFGEPVHIRRLPSPRELADAQVAYPGIDFSEGIAAAFTAAASLLRRWRAGFGDCPIEPPDADCPVARAVVETCVDWQRTGTSRPVPLVQLATLAEQRLARPEPITPEHFDAVSAWATTQTREAASLLLREPDGDEIATARADIRFVELLAENAGAVPAEIWTAAVAEARQAEDAEAAGRIAFQAHVVRNWEIAETVWAEVSSLDSADAEWLKLAAEFSHNRGDPRGEVLARTRRLELAELQYGPVAAQTAGALTYLGNALADFGHPDMARDHYERALRIYQDLWGSDHLEVASTLNNLGNASHLLGDRDKARDYHERALRIRQARLDPDHLDIARSLGNLGNAWLELGRPDRARDHYEGALRIYRDRLGPDHLLIANNQTNLGNAWRDLGKPDTARNHYERALHIYQNQFRPDHPTIAGTLSNLGNVWRDLGKPDTARGYHEQALHIRRERLGPNHPEVATSLNNLGEAWLDLGKPDTARDYHEQALRIRQERLGTDHPHFATSLSNLGNAWLDLGEPDKAREHHERALRIREKRLDLDHPEVAISLTNLGATWAALGNPEKAKDYLRRALTIFRTHYPPAHPHVRHVERALQLVDPDTIRVHGHVVALPDPDDTD